MTTQIILTLGVLSAAIVALLINRLRPDVVALVVLIALGALGLVPPAELFSGFSRSAVITVIAVFILTNGLYRTGVTAWMGDRLLALSGPSPARLTLVVMVAGAVLSWFMNTIAAGAILLPAIVGLSRKTSVRASKLLIPLASSTLLGGMATLLTTSNILVNAGLRDSGLTPFGVLDFLPVGGAMAAVGILYMATLGRRLLPDRSPSGQQPWAQRLHTALTDLYSLSERLCEALVEAGSPVSGKTIAESHIGEKLGLSILAIARNGRTLLAPKPDDRLMARDVLLLAGREERVAQLSALGITVEPDIAWEEKLSSQAVSLFEVLVAPRSRVVGQTLKQIHFRQKFGLTAIALWRGGQSHRTDVGDMPLQFGDALLMHGARNKIQALQADPDFIVLQPEPAVGEPSAKGVLAAVIMLATLAAAGLGWFPIAEATFTGAVLMVLSGCLSIDQAYQAVEWRAVFLIAGMLPLGIALQESGAAAFLGQTLVQTVGAWGPLALLCGLFVLATLLTQFISGQATAVIITPIALSAASQAGVSPYAYAMAAALACSTAFLTPIAHPVNLLMMGPAGYTPRDYLRAGLPLSALCLVTMMIVLPLVRPL